MDNYRFYLSARVWNFESAEPDFSIFVNSSGASIGPGDGDLDGCTYFSRQTNLEHCSGLVLKANRSSFLLIWNRIFSAPTSMCAFVLLKKGLPRMRTSLCPPACQAPQNRLAQRNFLFLTEYSRRFLQGSGPIGRLVTGTLMLTWVLNSWVCRRPPWAWH